MPLRRLFSIEPLPHSGASIRLDARESHHGRNVLRLRVGDSVAVFDSAGSQFAATIARLDGNQLVLTLGDPVPPVPEMPIPLALHLALAKGVTFENVLQDAVELGVSDIMPFVADRSVPAIGSAKEVERKLERWQQILLGATKQCGRAKLTTISPPCSFESALAHPAPHAIRICCALDTSASRLSEALRSLNLRLVSSVALMIGPEGGLSPNEIASARDKKWHLISLGPRTLRVETAATAALTLIAAAIGEM